MSHFGFCLNENFGNSVAWNLIMTFASQELREKDSTEGGFIINAALFDFFKTNFTIGSFLLNFKLKITGYYISFKKINNEKVHICYPDSSGSTANIDELQESLPV
jgi:hypothetical protein